MNALAKTHPPFTSAEFYKMADRGAFAGFRVELRRGMIVKMSPQHYPHGRVQTDLIRALELAIERAGLPWEVVTGTTVDFGSGFNPMPDIAVLESAVMQGRTGPVPASAVRLIVEVSDSTLEDDMGEKREDYAQVSVAEYWVADVNARQVIRHAQPKGLAYTKELLTPLSAPLAMLTAPSVVAQIG